jgi:hypothetical protein
MVNLPDKKIVEDIIRKVDRLPQIECPVSHYFAPGIYVREMFIPAGTIAVGHIHKKSHICSVLMGKIAFLKLDRSVDYFEGPQTFKAGAGRKIVYTLTDSLVQNIHANPDNITDQDILEDLLIEKGEVFSTLINQGQPPRIDDQSDFETIVEPDLGEDFVPLPTAFKTSLTIRKSAIEGRGLFTTWPYTEDEYICPYMIGGRFTEAARYINHSAEPNAMAFQFDSGEIALFAIRNISGCIGGGPGDEITINYRELSI